MLLNLMDCVMILFKLQIYLYQHTIHLQSFIEFFNKFSQKK